jgi:hypothetical protein
VETAFDLFTDAVAKYPGNNCLGHRQGDGYAWQTYKEVAEQVAAVGSALAHVGVAALGRTGIYGTNCPEWMIALQVRAASRRPPAAAATATVHGQQCAQGRALPAACSAQACNRQTVACVPLYDTLGDNAIEYIIKHSGAQHSPSSPFPACLPACVPACLRAYRPAWRPSAPPQAKRAAIVSCFAGAAASRLPPPARHVLFACDASCLCALRHRPPSLTESTAVFASGDKLAMLAKVLPRVADQVKTVVYWGKADAEAAKARPGPAAH